MKHIFKGKIITAFRTFLLLPLFLILTSMGGGNSSPWSKENVSFPMMNLEIKATMDENKRQKEMKSKQDSNTAEEVINERQWKGFKEKVVTIQDRLRILSLALQAAPAGIQIQRESKKIYENQRAIIQEIEDAPYILVAALPSQIKFVDDLQMVIRFLTGIVLSYGAINQMEQAERKVLLDYAVDEVKKLRYDSSNMLFTIQELKLKIKRNTNAIRFYVNRDKQVVEEIMQNIKNF
ncbi:hypothetical protein [Vaginella massiliensis]|uniref:hypothetical protein n=1 Tax=Vaginella massiliensis TaxID=1816680 RepID=UPI000A822E90|nr:hypothetical protein [Vaginella massiliensis]